MMSLKNKKQLVSGAIIIILCMLPSRAWAAVRPPPINDNPPATPDPCQIVMLAAGLALVGCYVAYRLKKCKITGEVK